VSLTVARVKIFRFMTEFILHDMPEVRGPCVYKIVYLWGFKDFSKALLIDDDWEAEFISFHPFVVKRGQMTIY
jgi:hypothetical protein